MATQKIKHRAIAFVGGLIALLVGAYGSLAYGVYRTIYRGANHFDHGLWNATLIVGGLTSCAWALFYHAKHTNDPEDPPDV